MVWEWILKVASGVVVASAGGIMIWQLRKIIEEVQNFSLTVSMLTDRVERAETAIAGNGADLKTLQVDLNRVDREATSCHECSEIRADCKEGRNRREDRVSENLKALFGKVEALQTQGGNIEGRLELIATALTGGK